MLQASMRRREFITVLGAFAAAWPLATSAQQPGQTYRVGCLFPNPRGAPHTALFEELGRSGFQEGQNLTVDWRSFGQRADMAPDFAAEMIKIRPNVILAGGDPAIRAAAQVTSAIPILGITEDLVGAGFANSANKPGGNTTGVSVFAAELDGKRQEILIEAVPKIRRIAALADTNATSQRQSRALQDAARQRGIDFSIHWVTRPDEITPAIDAARKSRAEALNVLASPLLYGNRAEITGLVAALRLPAIYQWPEIAEEGGLVGFGPRIVHLYRGMVARQLTNILRGAKPADVPVEQPTKFDLVINLQTAKTIGIEIPAGLVSRADKLIR
jgi:putative ABC transport system substrate-binding protein